MENVPDPGQVPHVEGLVQAKVGAEAGDVLRTQRGVEVDARHVSAAGAVHKNERDQRHAQDDEDGGEEPPDHVLGQHQTTNLVQRSSLLLDSSYLPSVTQTSFIQGRAPNWLNGPKSAPWTRLLTPQIPVLKRMIGEGTWSDMMSWNWT